MPASKNELNKSIAQQQATEQAVAEAVEVKPVAQEKPAEAVAKVVEVKPVVAQEKPAEQTEKAEITAVQTEPTASKVQQEKLAEAVTKVVEIKPVAAQEKLAEAVAKAVEIKPVAAQEKLAEAVEVKPVAAQETSAEAVAEAVEIKPAAQETSAEKAKIKQEKVTAVQAEAVAKAKEEKPSLLGKIKSTGTKIFTTDKPKPEPKPRQDFVLAQASVGLQHLNHQPHPLPCQDSASATIKPRPILLVCDGAGSASRAEIGSKTLTTNLTRLCQSLEPLMSHLLDTQQPDAKLKDLVRVIIRHSIGSLEDLSLDERRSINDFRSTLNFALVGKEQTLWVKVGDGEIVAEMNGKLTCLGEHNKGEFANQTQFIDSSLVFSDVSWGSLPTKQLTGLALMSDGSAEKLVAVQRNQVAGQVSGWLDLLRHDKLKASDLYKRFYTDEFCARTSGDDRAISLWAAS